MNGYPYSDWFVPWLDKVEEGLERALCGHGEMAAAVSGHFGGVRGKRIRPALVLMTAGLLGGINEDSIRLATGMELVHMATLVHDDVVDESGLRRGVPTPNGKWGNALAVLTGDYLFAKAFRELSGLGNSGILSSLSAMVTTMCEGEWDQLNGRHDPTVGIGAYMQRIAGKTASFMGCCCECSAHLSGADQGISGRLRDYGYNLGIAFQIMDDILDFEGDPDMLGKPVEEDIATGVYTLPVILALSGGNTGLTGELEKRMPDPARVAGIVRASGSLRESREMAFEYASLAKESIRDFRDSRCADEMQKLADFVCARGF